MQEYFIYNTQEEADDLVGTTCFISPLFPGITDVFAIIDRVKSQCNLIWLENLNIRGDYKGRIFDWIHEKHPELDGLYRQIYSKNDRTYWSGLDAQVREYTRANGFRYVRNDDSIRAKHGELPVVCNGTL